MFGEKIKRKYALTDQGLINTRKGAVWTIIVNLLAMAGAGILYMLMRDLMGTLNEGKEIPNMWIYIGAVVIFVILSVDRHLQH